MVQMKWFTRKNRNENFFIDTDYIELDDEHAIFEVTIPEEWVGKTVGQLDIRKKYKINIMALKEDGQMDLGITPGTLLGDDATMLVLGNIRDIERCFKL